MSEPLSGTGRTRTGTCRLCDGPAEQHEAVGIYGQTPARWMTEPHAAPCGLPCFGGGARGREGVAAYREGRMHGLVGYPPGRYLESEAGPAEDYPGLAARPCPACTGLPPVPSR